MNGSGQSTNISSLTFTWTSYDAAFPGQTLSKINYSGNNLSFSTDTNSPSSWSGSAVLAAGSSLSSSSILPLQIRTGVRTRQFLWAKRCAGKWLRGKYGCGTVLYGDSIHDAHSIQDSNTVQHAHDNQDADNHVYAFQDAHQNTGHAFQDTHKDVDPAESHAGYAVQDTHAGYAVQDADQDHDRAVEHAVRSDENENPGAANLDTSYPYWLAGSRV